MDKRIHRGVRCESGIRDDMLFAVSHDVNRSSTMSKLTLLPFIMFCLRAYVQISMSNRTAGTGGFLQTAPTWEAKTKGYTSDIFYFGNGMAKKYLTTATNLENYVGEKYGTTMLTYMTTGKKIIRGRPKALTTSEAANQDEDDKEIRKLLMRAFVSKMTTLEDHIGKVYHLLLSHCHPSLRTRLRMEQTFIDLDGEEDAAELWLVIARVCNSNNVGENPIRTFLESMYDVLMIQPEDDVGVYLDNFQQRRRIAEKDGMTQMFASRELRDSCIESYEQRKDIFGDMYGILQAWQVCEKNGPMKAIADEEDRLNSIAIGKEALNEKVFAMIYLKRSGHKFADYRDSLDNDMAKGNDNFADDVFQQHRGMCLYKPPKVPSVPKQKTGTQHLQDEGKDTEKQKTADQHYVIDRNKPLPDGYDCYRCGRSDGTCPGSRNCKFDKKEDGSPVNDAATATKLLRKKQAEVRARDAAKEAAGTQHYMGGEIVPTDFEETVEEEEEHDGQCHVGFLFNQGGEIEEDTRSYTNFVYNQSHRKQPTRLELFQVLLDSQLTVNVFINPAFLRNIRKSKWTLKLRTQAGMCTIDQVGDLPGVGVVWYYPDGVANIISQHRAITLSKWRVSFDSDLYYRTGNPLDLCFNCTTSEGIKLQFSPTEKGLHVLDCTGYFGLDRPNWVFGNKDDANVIDTCLAGYSELNNSDGIDTIEKSKSRFSARDIRRAERTRRLQYVSGHPSDETLSYASDTNGLKNNKVTRRDVRLARDMLGISEHAMAGKRTRTQPDAVNAEEQLVALPPSILNYYKDVELSVDVLHVNRLPFLASVSKNIHFTTIDALDNMKTETMERVINMILRSYGIRGFRVITVHVDIQFKAISDRKTLECGVNVVSRGEHVPEIERMIRVLKERARCYISMLAKVGIHTIPKIMVMHIMRTVTFYLNAFVWRRGVSQILPPLTIVKGIALDYNKHFHVIPGEYLHTYEGTTNTMRERTTSCLALGPSDNLQGGVRCYSLSTGKVLHRMKSDITIMKMPVDAIRRLRYRTRKEKSLPGLVFGDRNNTDIPVDGIAGVDDDDESNCEQHATELETEEEEEGQDNTDQQKQEPKQEEVPIGIEERIDDNDQQDPAKVEDIDVTDVTGVPGVMPEHRYDEVGVPDLQATESDEDSDSEDEEYRTRSGRISKPRDFEAEFPAVYGESELIIASKEDINYDEVISPLSEDEYQLYVEALQWFDHDFNEIDGMMFKAETMSIQKGIKQFGEIGKDSARKEIDNLLGNECFGEINFASITQEMKDQALPMLMFMIMKRNGNLKSRAVANGSYQRVYTDKEDCTSPTPDFYAFKYIVAVIAKEGRDCATVDLPGFFLQTEQDKDKTILLKLTGSIAMLLIEIDPKWRKYLVEENGKKVIYVVCSKAIYGTMNAALLAYKKLAKLFLVWGFVMNPYDPCVWNIMVGRDQMTIMFHIDDLLMSHKKAEIVTRYIKLLTEEYGKRDPLTVTRGLVHEYLGMTFDLRTKGEVALSQYDYIKKMNTRLPDEMKGKNRSTPAPADLFKQKDNDAELDKDRQQLYHTITAETLWLSQRSRPDTQLATGYHCTRVKNPTENDWAKLIWEQQYIWTTRFIPLIIAITEKGAIIYIDGAHATHTDSKGHSGLYATLGKGAMINVSKKVSLNTLSSTETEVVSTGERLPKCIWFRYFRIWQGDEPVEDVLMQDNKSAMILQRNWPFSTRKGSQHINIKYFFATDKIKSKEIKMVHCPTERMIADYNSKPLQGKLFYDNRNMIMGINTDHFERYKDRYAEVLKAYDLFEGEDDLYKLV